MPPKKIGQTIKRLRRAKGWSMKDLGEAAGITDAYVAMLETGVRGSPSLNVLRRLAKALGVPVTELLG